jgi:hypothetical protein
VWLILIPLILAFAIVHTLIPLVPHPENRDLGEFLGTDAGENLLSGAWGWFALIVLLQLFNSALGERPSSQAPTSRTARSRPCTSAPRRSEH